MSFPSEELSTVEDFLRDEAFRVWMLERRPDDRERWLSWLTRHPDKRDVYEQAVATFLVLQGQPVTLTDSDVKAKADAIVNRFDTPTVIRPLWHRQWARWAAVAALAGCLAWWQLPDLRSLATRTMRQGLQAPDDEWLIVTNETSEPLVSLLPDGSSVLLAEGSTLRYRKRPNAAVREVYFQGDGFFEVAKNPSKPFIVYTSNVVTKVVGTSFQVRSFEKESTAFVKVKTGKVMVASVAAPDKPVSLTVNQELTLKPTNKPAITQKNRSSDEEISTITTRQFSYDYVPVSTVFDQLETSYHIPIEYDRDLLKNCTFTGQLDDVPFREKIRLICLTIESTFDVTDHQVVIQSQGCN
ncbi:anti-FecI sigma factor, FecR [Fibrella aestuarina BUZ 2]|uniref:Anti-FecI sigma factor, FecR n=1 Tax=Fibrella aestuarina BUZ 2 TaxID=1166018 RepID=I0K8B1_9BACT|nr:FecR family protein [Fibrella aestuarina]CCH00364.1 anti-FecI sigma factor, FecR [Fibrella aestuarina BUZ 2]